MLALTRLSKRYGSRTALSDLSLTLSPGEFVGLLGPNGAGKSTLVKLVVGLLSPDAGTVRVGTGSDAGCPTRAQVRRRIGVAPQELALYEQLTGAENLAFFASLFGLRGTAARERADWALQVTGLGDRAGDRVATYSGGMQRRLNLAAALLHDPDLLVLDEPTAGVDPQARVGIIDVVLELQRAGKTILYTTHYLEEIADRCDRVAILDGGRLIAEGDTERLVAEHGGPRRLRARVAGQMRERCVDDSDQALSLLEAWRSEGSIEHFELRPPTLAEAFLRLTGKAWRD